MNSPDRQLRGLYVITDRELIPSVRLLQAVTAAIRGGARLVQYRDKSGDHTRRLQEAQALLEVCREQEIPLIINDDVALAAEIGADGVHVGDKDASLEEARVTLGPHAIIGVSCYGSLERALQAERAGADYVAFSSPFRSPTKPESEPAPLALLATAHTRLSIPICVIGGITAQNGGKLVTTGANMLAVISGVFAQTDIEAAAQRYAQLFT